MKKFFMTLGLALCFSSAVLAAGNQPTTSKWEGEINVYKLSQYLNLSSDQTDEVSNICDYFSTQMRRANFSKKNQNNLLRYAIYSNLKLMKNVLTKEQYSKYSTVLNMTLVNKGIELNDK
jgi:hypothetical protein